MQWGYTRRYRIGTFYQPDVCARLLPIFETDIRQVSRFEEEHCSKSRELAERLSVPES